MPRFAFAGEGSEPSSLNLQAMLRYVWLKKRRRRNFPVTLYSRLAFILKRMFEFGWVIWRVGNAAEYAIAKSGSRHGGTRQRHSGIAHEPAIEPRGRASYGKGNTASREVILAIRC